MSATNKTRRSCENEIRKSSVLNYSNLGWQNDKRKGYVILSFIDEWMPAFGLVERVSYSKMNESAQRLHIHHTNKISTL